MSLTSPEVFFASEHDLFAYVQSESVELHSFTPKFSVFAVSRRYDSCVI